MAQKIIEEILDDVDGTPGATAYHFTYNGIRYIIDLAGENATKFENQMAFWVDRARPDYEPRTARRATTRTVVRAAKVAHQPRASREAREAAVAENKAVRDWWRTNASMVRLRTRREFSEFGRIPEEIRALYAEMTKA